MKKQLLTLLLTVCCLSAAADEPLKYLLIWANNGAKTTYALKDNPQVTFTDDALVVTKDGQETSFPMGSVQRFTYERIMLGDVNGDAKVDIVDVAKTINYLLTFTRSDFPEQAADIDKSGTVDSDDVTAMIKLVVNGQEAYIPASSQQATGEAFYIYRNDGQFNAFFRDEVEKMEYSNYDTDGNLHAEVESQVVYTADSIYNIPLTAIDSVGFVTPVTVYKKDVTRLEYNLLDYILGADGLTLKLKSETPAQIVPVKGDKLVLLEGCDALPYGFSGIVSNVQFSSSFIEVVCEQAYLEDMFDSFCSASTIYGENPDEEVAARELSNRGRRPVTYRPNDVVFTLGPYKINRSYEVSQGIAFDGDLALSGGASYSVEVKPTFKIHTFLILGEGHGMYFQYRITGDLQVATQSSLYGGLSYNHDWDGLVVSCPIPMTGNMVNFYINPGLFVRADATIASSITSTQNYTFGSSFDFSSKGENTVKPSIGGRLASSTVDMSGSLDGSLAGGAYIETGFNLLSREIAKVCVRGEIGARLSGSFVFRNSDIENASKETKLYERLKESNVELGSFVNVSLQASVAHTGNGITWELSEPIHTWNLVPEFSNTKLTQTSGSKTSVDAYTELRGDCLFPVSVGYKLFDADKNEVGNYDAGTKYTNKASKMEHTFSGLEETKLYGYKVYPKVNLFGFDVLASPEAGLKTTSCPDANHPHWIDLGLPSGTQWRCCNEGASTPEVYGGYYTFGQVSSAPTLKQIKELLSNTTSVWTTQNGVAGRMFTGSNGGTIFLPAAGFRWKGEFYHVGTWGYYWSSTPDGEYEAYDLGFDSVIAGWGDGIVGRLGGQSVRPVR